MCEGRTVQDVRACTVVDQLAPSTQITAEIIGDTAGAVVVAEEQQRLDTYSTTVRAPAHRVRGFEPKKQQQPTAPPRALWIK
jgi:3-oxoacyl-[acyl-carrier-protein] synthase III